MLKHGYSYSKLEESHVYLVGIFRNSIPKIIEDSPNVSIYELVPFFNYPKYYSILLYPLMMLFYLIQIISVTYKIRKARFVFASTNKIFMHFICSYLLKFLKKAKFVFDISVPKSVPTKNVKNYASNYYGSYLLNLCDIRICSTRSMQGFFKLKKLDSHVIRDTTGPLFCRSIENRSKIESLLGIESNIPVIVIPFPFLDEEMVQSMINICVSIDSIGIKLALIIFGGGKSQKSLETKFKKLEFKHIQCRILPLLSEAYPIVLSACDFGIILSGSRLILDISQELIEFNWSCVPSAVFLNGCVKEIIKENETGFLYSNTESLIKIMREVFVEKKHNLDLMSQEISSHLESWESNWHNVFCQYMNF